MYRRIAQELRQQIKSGHPGPGEQLPTELELGERYEASRNTVRDAIKWLTVNGLVETRPGQGTFVRPRITPFITTLSMDPETGLGGGEGNAAFAEVRERGREPSASLPRVTVQLAAGNIAARLRVPDETQVICRYQRPGRRMKHSPERAKSLAPPNRPAKMYRSYPPLSSEPYQPLAPLGAFVPAARQIVDRREISRARNDC
jgi:DNA-binding transcriptional MocR family regulator